jgi:hypothetical protein
LAGRVGTDMPTKRRKIPPRRIGGGTPQWARDLVERGVEPPTNSEAEVAYVGWLFFDESVPGLPPAESDEGWQIRSKIKRKRKSAA